MNDPLSDPLNGYMEKFLGHLRDDQHTESTITAYRHCLVALSKAMLSRLVDLKSLTPEMVHSLVMPISA